MATIGQTLSAARIAAGCSLENLSTRTRIRMQVLRGIENEDFVPCGGDFYARGHIRRICKFLGLDPAPLLEEYDREHASNEKPTFVPPPRHPSARTKATRVAAAQGGRAHTGTDDHEAPQDVPRSVGDVNEDPEQRAESWGYFERKQRLARSPRRNRPKGFGNAGAGAGSGAAAAAGVPEPRTPGRHSKPAERAAAGAAAAKAAAPRPRATRASATAAGTRRAESVRRHWPWAVVGLILIAAVFVGVRTWQGWDDGNPVRTAFESAGSNTGDTVDSAAVPEEAAAADDRSAASEALAAAEEAEAAAAAGAEPVEFTVGLTATDRSWVKVSEVEGEALFTGFLVAGESQDYTTEVPLTLWVGNAGAVEVAVDGQDQGPSGGSGEVREITVGADGFDN